MITNDTFHPLKITPSKTPKTLKTHEDILKEELMEYFKDHHLLERISSIVSPKASEGNPVSLRLLEWFVTNYSKKNYTIYEIQRGDHTILFKVFVDYKINLDIYSKKLFAPCCRFERIYVPFENDTLMETTLAQLNFFRWAFKNYILEYIEANYEDIKHDMELRNTVSSRKRRTNSDKSVDQPTATIGISNTISGAISSGKTRKKREELSSSACQSMRLERGVKTTFKFG